MSATPVGTDGTRRSVLVVEDEAMIRELLLYEFEDADFVVHEAGSADEAIALLDGQISVAAVVTDLRMPGSMDGAGLVEWLRRHYAAVPVVVTSGYVADSRLADADPVGKTHIVPKPYKVADVVALVSSLIG